MDDRSKLALASLILQRKSQMEVTHFLHLHHTELKEEEGLRYCDCRALVEDKGINHVEFDKFGGMQLLADVEFELIEMHEGIRPHFHKRSDSVIVACAPFNAHYFEALFDISDQAATYFELHDRQVLYVPRGLVHGFRRRPNKGQYMWLLVASCPAIAPDDTFYV